MPVSRADINSLNSALGWLFISVSMLMLRYTGFCSDIFRHPVLNSTSGSDVFHGIVR